MRHVGVYELADHRAWFYSSLELTQLGDLMVEHGLCLEFTYDYENVFQWIELSTHHATNQWNVSRKHSQGGQSEREPIMMVWMTNEGKPEKKKVEEMAGRVANLLGIEVYLGKVAYLGGDECEFIPEKIIVP